MAPRDMPAGGYVSDYLGFWAVWAALLVLTVAFVRRSRRRGGRLRLVAGNVLVLASLLWTAVLATETWLRYFHDATDSYGLTLTNWSWFGRHVRVNARGFRERDEAPPPRREGLTRVACVGDSFTFGYGVPDVADAWPQRLAALLEERRPGAFDARNYGVVGLDTGAESQLVRDVLARGDADHVVLGYCLNDVDDLMPPGERFDRAQAPRVPWIEPTRSFLADHLWFRLKLRSDPRVRGYFDWIARAYEDEAVVATQRARARRVAETCRAAGAPLDVLVFPMLSAWGEEPYRFAAAQDCAVELWRAAGARVVDLRAAYRGVAGDDLVVNRHDAHPNERAHDLAARAAAELLLTLR